jgi:twitching motility protein PilU
MSSVVVDDMNEQLGSLLEHMPKINASDLYLIAAHPPVFRVDDVSYPARVPLEADDIAAMAGPLLSAAGREATAELSVAFAWLEDRFRASIFYQRGQLGIVVRRVSPLRTLGELSLGAELHDLALIERGLVLLAGDKRSGRSTTLAALIDHRNATKPGHILTIEDPIEQVHTHKQAIVTQRELGTDTASYVAGLRSAPGLAPDLIVVDELKDAAAAEELLALAGAGYACFAALHAQSVGDALDRVVGLFPVERHAELRSRLALTLRAVAVQRLVPAHEGRRAAIELLLDTPAVRELIRAGDFDMLARAVAQKAGAAPDNARAAPLRLAPDVYEPQLNVGERRSKVNPAGR